MVNHMLTICSPQLSSHTDHTPPPGEGVEQNIGKQSDIDLSIGKIYYFPKVNSIFVTNRSVNAEQYNSTINKFQTNVNDSKHTHPQRVLAWLWCFAGQCVCVASDR